MQLALSLKRSMNFTRSPVVGAYVILVLLLVVVGPGLAPFSPTEFHPQSALQPPDAEFWFGTDEYGRDIFSRVLWGARQTILVALASAFLGVALGAPTGLLAGYMSGWIDETVMRVMDVLMSFPALILAMFIVVLLGSSQVVVVAAIGVVFWPRSARIVRAVAQELASREYIEAARARGESTAYILIREMLPNVMNIVVVDFALRFSSAILLTASLSYLGVGVSAPEPAWGLMVREGQLFLQIAPWIALFPCFAIAVVSAGAVLSGDATRRWISGSVRTIDWS